MGICLRRLVRGAPASEAGDHPGRLIAIGESDCGRPIHAGNVVSGPATPVRRSIWIAVASANTTIPAGAIDARWGKALLAGRRRITKGRPRRTGERVPGAVGCL